MAGASSTLPARCACPRIGRRPAPAAASRTWPRPLFLCFPSLTTTPFAYDMSCSAQGLHGKNPRCLYRIHTGRAEGDILKMGILIWVPLPTSQMPCGKWGCEHSQSPLPFTSQVGCGKLEFRSEKWEFRGEKWEFRSEKWESGKLISHFSHGIWEVGSGTQMRIPIFKISSSAL